MPRISVSFQGYITGVPIGKAMDIDCNEIDVCEMPAEELVKKLREGDLFLSLHDLLEEGGRRESIELFDYDLE